MNKNQISEQLVAVTNSDLLWLFPAFRGNLVLEAHIQFQINAWNNSLQRMRISKICLWTHQGNKAQSRKPGGSFDDPDFMIGPHSAKLNFGWTLLAVISTKLIFLEKQQGQKEKFEICTKQHYSCSFQNFSFEGPVVATSPYPL